MRFFCVLLVNIFVGTIFLSCWFKYVGDAMMALLMTIYTDKLETGEEKKYIYI